MNEKKLYMKAAVDEAFLGLERNDGGPFGAVIVKDGVVISQAHNCVIASNDPTAHAEIMAIRAASQKLGRFDLSDCELYSSCEPCPMCLAAIHWAKIKKLYFGATRSDAASAGFDDEYIYEVLKGTAQTTRVSHEQIDREACLGPFAQWNKKSDKVSY